MRISASMAQQYVILRHNNSFLVSDGGSRGWDERRGMGWHGSICDDMAAPFDLEYTTQKLLHYAAPHLEPGESAKRTGHSSATVRKAAREYLEGSAKRGEGDRTALLAQAVLLCETYPSGIRVLRVAEAWLRMAKRMHRESDALHRDCMKLCDTAAALEDSLQGQTELLMVAAKQRQEADQYLGALRESVNERMKQYSLCRRNLDVCRNGLIAATAAELRNKLLVLLETARVKRTLMAKIFYKDWKTMAEQGQKALRASVSRAIKG